LTGGASSRVLQCYISSHHKPGDPELRIDHITTYTWGLQMEIIPAIDNPERMFLGIFYEFKKVTVHRFTGTPQIVVNNLWNYIGTLNKHLSISITQFT
jgi:hypothetical protein